jgi:hypothetical protein
MEYWLHTSEKKTGPHELHELLSIANIDGLHVWCVGLPDWILLKDLEAYKAERNRKLEPPEFKSQVPVFEKKPPVFQYQKENLSSEIEKGASGVKERSPQGSANNKLSKFVLYIALGFGLLYFISRIATSVNNDPITYDDLASQSVEIQTAPTFQKSVHNSSRSKSFRNDLTVSGNGKKKKLLGQFVVEGTIHNNSNTNTYKNIEIQIEFLSNTGEVIDHESKVLYEFVNPGKSLQFKVKAGVPKSANDFSISITDAD